jgi:2-methylisocitrate lyase-like PEP mutase family enzyme
MRESIIFQATPRACRFAERTLWQQVMLPSAARECDVLFAPGLKTREEIAAVVAAVAPRPVNVVNGGAGAFTVADLVVLGVRRISLGGGLARAAWGGFLKAAQLLASEGRFDGLASGTSGGELNTMFEGRSGLG